MSPQLIAAILISASLASCAGAARENLDGVEGGASPPAPSDGGAAPPPGKGDAAAGLPYLAPREVSVLPLFFVPAGEQSPTAEQRAKLAKHVEWAQRRYRELLRGVTTFRIADKEPHVVQGARSLGVYKNVETGPGEIVAELLARYKVNRFTSPYIFQIVLMNSKDEEPGGVGRPCNGGLDTGGGLLVTSSTSFESKNFQSTLQHELGHSFGLPHVDVYGLDMFSNPSLMSYNLSHHTSYFEPSATPGAFIPEDLRALAMNERVFAGLDFDPARDLPAGYKIAPDVVTLGPMEIPGQVPNVVEARTSSGEEYGSSVRNIVQGAIKPSKGPGVTYDPGSMWHSAETSTGWVSAEVVFPLAVTLTKVAVHTEHSGQAHRATALRLEMELDGALREVVTAPLAAADVEVSFAPTTARSWRFHLQAGASKMVVVRGLQFFAGADEVFPPLVPYAP
jgi:hypothetical protein